MRAEYCKYLRSSLYYLDLATENTKGIAPRILSRVYGTKGNVYKMLGDYSAALRAAQDALKVNPTDYSALYNSACYEALLAGEEHKKGDHGAVTAHEDAMVTHLREAIRLHDHYRHQAADDEDFTFVKEKSRFLQLIAEK